MLHSILLCYAYNSTVIGDITEPTVLIPAVFLLFEYYPIKYIWHICSLE